MTYTFITTLSALVLLIVNIEIFRPQFAKKFPAGRQYQFFLLSVLVFHLADVGWGICEAAKTQTGLYAITVVFFVFQAGTVYFWARYVFKYLATKDVFHRIIFWLGVASFAFQLIVVIVNFFNPVLFSVDAKANYYTGPLRYTVFGVQMIMFFVISVYTMVIGIRSKGRKKASHLAIAVFGLLMFAAIVLQIFYPYMPYYSVGYLLGICALHTFVVTYEKDRVTYEMEAARQLAFTDPMTGVRSRHAYLEIEAMVNKDIERNDFRPFAVAVFDLNDLKVINDNKGHKVGDDYIIKASRYISKTFRSCPIFRVGGDEFVAVIYDEDYENRVSLIDGFLKQVEANLPLGGPSIAVGCSDYLPGDDTCIRDVFIRADRAMYACKRRLKEKAAQQ